MDTVILVQVSLRVLLFSLVGNNVDILSLYNMVVVLSDVHRSLQWWWWQWFVSCLVFCPEIGGLFIRNVGICVLKYMASHQ
jgi:hypothetical protein